MSASLRKFKRDVEEVVACLQSYLDGTKTDNLVPAAFQNIHFSHPQALEQIRAALPLCDMVGTAWRRARLQAGNSNFPPFVDAVFILVASTLPALNDNFEILLDAGAWAPGERLRQLSPLAALLEYAATSSGLQAMPLGESLSQYLFDADTYLFFGHKLILDKMVTAIDKGRQVGYAVANAGDAEFNAACRAGFSADKIDAAKWGLLRALGRASPAAIAVELCLKACSRMMYAPSFQIFDSMLSGEVEVTESAIARSVDSCRILAAMGRVVAERPQEMREISEDEDYLGVMVLFSHIIAALLHVGGFVALTHFVASPEALPLAALARGAREIALASQSTNLSTQRFWFHMESLRIHPLHDRTGLEGDIEAAGGTPAVFEALSDATTAFNSVLCTMDAKISQDDLLKTTSILRGALNMAVGGDMAAAASTATVPASLHSFSFIQAKATVPEYVIVLQCARALVAAASLSPPLVKLLLTPMVHVFPPSPGRMLTEIMSFDQESILLATAVDLVKYSLGPSLAVPMAPPVSSSALFHRHLFAWFCSAAFENAWEASKAPPASQQGINDEQKQRTLRALAAATMKYLRFAAQEKDAMKAVFVEGKINQFYDDPEAVQRVFSILAQIPAAMSPVLEPALAGADVEGLQVLSELMASTGMAGDAVAAVDALAAAAAGRDPRDEAAAVARARLLAELDCSYLGNRESTPLCELIVTWQHARLHTGQKFPLFTDIAFCLAAGALPAENPLYDFPNLLDPTKWAPGERAKVLIPLGALMDFVTADAGLPSLAFDAAHLSKYRFKVRGRSEPFTHDVIARMASSAISRAARVESLVHSLAAAGRPDRELEACLVAFDSAKRDATAWKILQAWARTAPTPDDLGGRVAAWANCSTTSLIEEIRGSGMNIDDVSQSAIGLVADSGRLLVSLASSIAAAPRDLLAIAKDEHYTASLVELGTFMAQSVFVTGLEEVRDVMAAPGAASDLVSAARYAREIALEYPEITKFASVWLFLAVQGTQPPPADERVAGAAPPAVMIEALRESTAALDFLISHKEEHSQALLEVMSSFFLSAFCAAQTGALGRYLGGQIPLSEGERPNFYFEYAKKNAAAYPVVLEGARMLLVAAPFIKPAFSITGALLSLFYPGCRLPGVRPVDPDTAVAAAGVAIDLMKFTLGPIPATLPPVHGISARALFIWFSSVAVRDVYDLYVLAGPAPRPRNDAEREQRQRVEKALAAAVLKLVRLASDQPEIMKDVFLHGALHALSNLADPDFHFRNVRKLFTTFLQTTSVLQPALLRSDAAGLQVISELSDASGIPEEMVQEVGALAAVTAAAAPRDVTAAVARARLLADIDCSYLGCTNVRPRGAKPPKRCSDCLCARFDSVDCQRADWPAHSIACKAMKAERGA